MTFPCRKDLCEYWEESGESYARYPTVRHRNRFLLKTIRRQRFDGDTFFFDYGCGTGSLLRHVRDEFGLRDSQVGGCDISPKACELTRAVVSSPFIYAESCPPLERKCDFIVCSEVIEHLEKPAEILEWIADNMAPNGLLALTTPSGRRCKIDRWVGHLQHFNIHQLKSDLERLGFAIEHARLWGFPLVSVQKWVSDLFFKSTCSAFLEGKMNPAKRLVFNAADWVYFIHNPIFLGPQIFIRARRR